MPGVTIQLPPQRQQTEFNLRRWAEIQEDPELAKVPGRIETDRYGYIVMSPPPAPNHGNFQVEVAHLLRQLLPNGRTISECPISTAMKAADVAWSSQERWTELAGRACFTRAPEICVEVTLTQKQRGRDSRKNGALFRRGREGGLDLRQLRSNQLLRCWHGRIDLVRAPPPFPARDRAGSGD